MFDQNTDPSLRNQILKYHVSQVMTDRERAELLGLPEGCRIRENAKIISPENLKCGKNVWIGEGAVLDASGGLEIGDNTQIGLYTLIWSHSSIKQALSGQTGTTNKGIVRKPTKIGRNCFIGGQSTVYPGVVIGDSSVVLPMSLVSKDIPERSISSGEMGDRLKDLENKVKSLEGRLELLERRD